MAGNSIGQIFTVTTCGESHGAGLMAIVDGVPPGLELCEAGEVPTFDNAVRYLDELRNQEVRTIIEAKLEKAK